MTEKEKLIEIIKQNGVYNGSSMGIEYYVVKPEWLADTLIENGIGDIAEWKEKYARLKKSDTSKENCTIEQHNEIHYLRDKLKQTQKECAELREQVKFYKETTKVKILPNGEMVFERASEKEIEEERK